MDESFGDPPSGARIVVRAVRNPSASSSSASAPSSNASAPSSNASAPSSNNSASAPSSNSSASAPSSSGGKRGDVLHTFNVPKLSPATRAAFAHSIGAGTFDADTGMLVLRSQRLESHVSHMTAVMEQRMDAVYNFAGLVAGHLPGRDLVNTFWRGEAAGSAAIGALLRQNERLLQASKPDIGIAKEPLDLPEDMKRARKQETQPGQSTPTSAVSLSSSAAADAAADEAPAEKFSKAQQPQPGWSVSETLMWMLGQDNLTETKLRALDMLFYHGAQYIPPGAHQVYTPEASIELARKWLQLQRFFEVEAGGDFESYRVSDEEEWFPLFLDDSLRSPLLATRDMVWDVCGHSEVPLVDLMTAPRVRSRFAEMVALRIKLPQHFGATRNMSVNTAGTLTMSWNAIINLFRTLTYTDEGELVFARTFDAQKERERRAREAHGHALTSASVTSADARRLLEVRPLAFGIDNGSAGQNASSLIATTISSGTSDRERDRAAAAPAGRQSGTASRMARAFGAAQYHRATGRRVYLVNADEL